MTLHSAPITPELYLSGTTMPKKKAKTSAAAAAAAAGPPEPSPTEKGEDVPTEDVPDVELRRKTPPGVTIVAPGLWMSGQVRPETT